MCVYPRFRVFQNTIEPIDGQSKMDQRRKRQGERVRENFSEEEAEHAEKDTVNVCRLGDQVEAEKLFIFLCIYFLLSSFRFDSFSPSFVCVFFVSVCTVCVEHGPLVFTTTTTEKCFFFLSP